MRSAFLSLCLWEYIQEMGCKTTTTNKQNTQNSFCLAEYSFDDVGFYAREDVVLVSKPFFILICYISKVLKSL